jgi:type II secretion system protein N
MKTKSWILYVFYAVVVAVFFLYYLFPSQILKNYIIAQASRVNPDFRLTAGKAELVFPFKIRLHNVDLDHVSDRLLQAEQVTIAPRLLSLIGKKNVFAFSLKAYQGLITGTAEIADGQRLMLNAVASKIQLADMQALNKLSTNRVEGVLEGTLNYAAGNGRLETLNFNFKIINMTIILAVPFFTLEKIRFDNVQAEAVLQNQQLKISQVILTGDQIEGNLSGYALINNDVRNAIVNLSGTVMPQQKFIKSSGFQIPPSFLDSLKSGGGLPIRISGPIDDLRLETK